ncbi:ANR family transcriptional regulator [Enterobacter ludwigii]
MKEEKTKAKAVAEAEAGAGTGAQAGARTQAGDVATRRGRRSLSDEMALQADISLLRQGAQARYRTFALAAAQDEREGRFAAAAQAWGEALKTARGDNVEWCQSRLTLCLLYARSASLPQVVAGKLSRD